MLSRRSLLVSGSALTLAQTLPLSAKTLKPPIAEVILKTNSIHGDTRIDDYFWLREKTNPKVISYLKAENTYTAAIMAPTVKLQKQLYQEILGRFKQTDLSVPEKSKDYYYYTRTIEGQQYPIDCRKKGSLAASEEIMLDQNALAKGKDYFRVGISIVSPDQKLLAYTVDTNGAEKYEIQIKNLSTGQTLSDRMNNTAGYTLAWAKDSQTLFYVTLDAAQRSNQVYRHHLGENKDTLVLEEKNELYNVDITATRSEEYILISSSGFKSSEVYYLDANTPKVDFKSFAPRIEDVLYSVDHRGDKFYILTNEDALNFKVMEALVVAPEKVNWTQRVAHQATVLIEGIDLFKNYLVVYQRTEAVRRIHIYDLVRNVDHQVDFPEVVYTFINASNPEFNTQTLRFIYTSLATPRSVYDYNMDSRERVLKKKDEIRGYTAQRYQSERIYATASDGTKVPISLVYKKGLVKNGKNPTYLYAYGSYGFSTDPIFSAARVSLLDRGFVYAIAHIRGGQEMGRSWYDQGKLLNKKNTFTDFIACAEYLIAQNYTNSAKLAISGASAGGLLMGAVTNLRPDLYKTVVAKVPFVDVINTMLDPTIPLTVEEYTQWGNPNDKEYYDYMKSYSPYDNVIAQNYPNILITAGLNDPRVAYWEPTKWTAKLRKLKTDHNLLLLKTNLGAGHGGPSGRYDAIKETAFEYAFVLTTLGIKNSPT